MKAYRESTSVEHKQEWSESYFFSSRRIFGETRKKANNCLVWSNLKSNFGSPWNDRQTINSSSSRFLWTFRFAIILAGYVTSIAIREQWRGSFGTAITTVEKFYKTLDIDSQSAFTTFSMWGIIWHFPSAVLTRGVLLFRYRNECAMCHKSIPIIRINERKKFRSSHSTHR